MFVRREADCLTCKINMNRTFIGLLLTIVWLALTAPAFSQIASTFTAVKTAEGMIVKHSNPAHPFSLLITGKQITNRKTSDGKLKVVADGRIYTLSLVKTSDIVDLTKKLSAEEILTTNREFNTWLQASKLTGAIRTTVQGIDRVEIAGSPKGGSEIRPSVYWSTLNEGTSEEKFFQTLLLGDSILTIEIAFGKGDKVEALRSSARKIVGSLKT